MQIRILVSSCQPGVRELEALALALYRSLPALRNDAVPLNQYCTVGGRLGTEYATSRMPQLMRIHPLKKTSKRWLLRCSLWMTEGRDKKTISPRRRRASAITSRATEHSTLVRDQGCLFEEGVGHPPQTYLSARPDVAM